MPPNPDRDWDETKDRDFADWKRVRAAIEHENELTHHRLTWLLAMNAVLVTAFGALIGKVFTISPTNTVGSFNEAEKIVLVSLAVCGILFSIFSASGLYAAHEQHTRLVNWWYTSPQRSDRKLHPEIVGNDPKVFFFHLHYHHVPIIFILLWGLLLSAGLLQELRANLPWIISATRYLVIAIAFLGVLLASAVLGVFWARRHPKAAEPTGTARS